MTIRYYTGERLSHVIPVTVVDDSSDCIALYLAAGTMVADAVYVDGSPIPRSLPYEERWVTPWKLGCREWHSHDRLYLSRPGAAHAISLFWEATTRHFLAWYVDLQAPFRRTDDGFESEDHVLDIVIAPDLSWRWKDEDEFDAALRIGRFTPRQAARIRSEGESVIELLLAGSWPFDAGWETWRPDPDWTVPTLPDGRMSR